MNRQCWKCEFYVVRHYRDKPTDQLEIGECRKNAPMGTVFEGGLFTYNFPVVNSDDWCGEFRERKDTE